MHYHNISDSFLEQLLTRRHGPGSLSNFSIANITKDHRADPVAQGSLSAIQLTTFAIKRFRLRTLRKIDEAIERWRHGKYGKCLECKHPIREPRLSALPEAERCLRCQHIEENESNRN